MPSVGMIGRRLYHVYAAELLRNRSADICLQSYHRKRENGPVHVPAFRALSVASLWRSKHGIYLHPHLF